MTAKTNQKNPPNTLIPDRPPGRRPIAASGNRVLCCFWLNLGAGREQGILKEFISF